jgi:hypothetical protein
MLKAITAVVVQAQTAPDAIPLTLNAGDPVSVGANHAERAGYVWCDDGQLSAGWVPVDVLEVRNGGARANAEYCSAELDVAVGEVVRLLWEDAKHGAWWCENPANDRGWVRTDYLRFSDPD